jgi:hypothetical protein
MCKLGEGTPGYYNATVNIFGSYGDAVPSPFTRWGRLNPYQTNRDGVPYMFQISPSKEIPIKKKV